MNLIEIDSLTKRYSVARGRLRDLVQTLDDQIEALRRAAMPGIKAALNVVVERHANLESAIDGSRHLFVKPRTVVLHGTKVGLRKGSGGIDWDDDARVVALIEKHLPDQAEVLIKTTKKPLAKSLEQLDIADLKRIGCTVEATGDVVVIAAVDSDVDKIVKALIRSAEGEAKEAA